MSLTLRPYQQQAIHSLRLAYRAGSRAPLLVLPTGAGKTVVFSEITRSATERGRRILVLVHRRELIAQASHKLSLAGVTHGVIAAGFPDSDAPVQVASVQTLVRRLSRIHHPPDLIVIDEAHHATAGSWSRILQHWPDALRLGVTATPVRADGRGLSAIFDRLVLGPSVADLIGASFLSPARIYAPPVQADLTGIKRRAGDFAVEDAAERLDRPSVIGDAIAHYRRLADSQQAITFCCSLRHAEHVCESFNAAGIPAATLLGSTDPLDRDRIVAQFAAAQIRVLVTVDVVSEGFDIPAASCAILLRPTASLGLYLQQVGRVLRPAPGKTHAVILDHVGNVHRHGWPDDHRDWSLDGIARGRGSSGPPAPSVRTCPSCFAAFRPQLLCPLCGTYTAPPARQVRQVDGELKELRREAVRQRVAERKQARSIGELLALAKQRGYSPAWAWKVHNARSSRP
jgi:superfamily II DNA or RNA helicase